MIQSNQLIQFYNKLKYRQVVKNKAQTKNNQLKTMCCVLGFCIRRYCLGQDVKMEKEEFDIKETKLNSYYYYTSE